jgi:hypothetical protein
LLFARLRQLRPFIRKLPFPYRQGCAHVPPADGVLRVPENVIVANYRW